MTIRNKIITVAFCFIIFSAFIAGCAKTDADSISDSMISEAQEAGVVESTALSDEDAKDRKIWADMEPVGAMELSFAEKFGVDYYEDDYALINIDGEKSILLIPEGMDTPDELDENIVVVNMPINNIYLAATAAMDQIKRLDKLSIVKMTSTKASDWSDTDIAKKIDNGDIRYIGKYSSPDYELILNSGCDLAIENTMIYHKPEVKEQLERLGIPVLVEKSSYEPHPLGRVEWIKLYALLANDKSAADDFMDSCRQRFNEVVNSIDSDKKMTAAFFYISSNGYVNVRKPGDYISTLIELAGGEYIFNDLKPEEDNALSTMNLQMEAFYDKAADADCLIYNSTVIGEIQTMDDLIAINPILADFKAVKNNNVYCTNKNMFQESTAAVDILEDFYLIFSGTDKEEELSYIHKLD